MKTRILISQSYRYFVQTPSQTLHCHRSCDNIPAYNVMLAWALIHDKITLAVTMVNGSASQLRVEDGDMVLSRWLAKNTQTVKVQYYCLMEPLLIFNTENCNKFVRDRTTTLKLR